MRAARRCTYASRPSMSAARRPSFPKRESSTCKCCKGVSTRSPGGKSLTPGLPRKSRSLSRPRRRIESGSGDVRRLFASLRSTSAVRFPISSGMQLRRLFEMCNTSSFAQHVNECGRVWIWLWVMVSLLRFCSEPIAEGRVCMRLWSI